MSVLRTAGQRAFAVQRTSILASTRSTTTRSFSGLEQLRSSIRAIEPHPFRRATTGERAKADWSKQAKHIGNAAMFYFPMNAVFFGWIFAAEYLMRGNLG